MRARFDFNMLGLSSQIETVMNLVLEPKVEDSTGGAFNVNMKSLKSNSKDWVSVKNDQDLSIEIGL